MNNEDRMLNYIRQNNGSANFTPAQRRRINAKANRERDTLGEQIEELAKPTQEELLEIMRVDAEAEEQERRDDAAELAHNEGPAKL